MSVNTIFGSLLAGYTPSIILASIAFLLICWQRLSVEIDPKEPPLLKPRIPYVGHIIGILQHQIEYFDTVFAKSPKPICTFPMINSKIYVVTEPLLAQSVFRSKDLSFFPFMVEFSQKMLGVSDETMEPIKNIPKEAENQNDPPLLQDFVKEIHTAMMGEHLHRMNADALNNVADSLNDIGNVLALDSLYLWLRGMMTLATCNALMGSHSPFRTDHSLIDALWDFDQGLVLLLLNVFPSITAPTAYRGRANIQKALSNYYGEEHDLEPDVSQMVKRRAATLRKYGIASRQIGMFEIGLLNVSTANAIPTLFWLLCHICADASLEQSIRDEVSVLVTQDTQERSDGKRELSFDITKFESDCPLLVSCYREVIRLTNAHLGTRRVMKDTTISDGKNTYLLKEGCDVQIPFGITHLSTGPWGADSSTFSARRFLKPDPSTQSEKEKLDDKVQKRSYFPFGGGKHLCPGRNFAFAEILGTVAVLVLGFEVKSPSGGLITVPDIGRAQIGEAIAKPRGQGAQMGVKITRRKGWEDVTWKFVC